MDDIDSKELQTAVLVFAHYLGIDLDTEQELLSIAEEAFDQLPPGWEFGIGEGEHAGIPYFYNAATGQSEWKHPREELYMKKVKKEKQRIQDQRADKPKKAFDSPRANTNAKKEVEVVEVEDFDDSFESSKRPIDNKKTTTKAASSSPSKTKAQNNSGGFGMSSADFFDESGAENDRREDSKGAINSAGKSKSQSQSLPPMRDRYEGTNKHKDYDSSVASYSPRENYSDSDYVDDSRGRGTKTKKVNYQSSFGSRNSSAQNSADEAPLKSERSQSRAQSPTKNTVESKRPASAMGIGNRDWFAEPETTEKDLSRTFPPRKQEKDTKASERDYDRNNDRRYNYDDRRRRDEPGHLSIVSVADSRDEGDNFYETETDRRKYRDQDRDRDFDKSRNRDRDRDRDRNIGKDSRPRNPAWDDRGGRDSGVYTKQTQSRSLSPVKNDREVQDAIDSAVAVATEKLEVQHKREIQKCFDEIDQLKKDLEEQGDRNTSTSKRLNSEIATYKEDIRKLDEKLVSERADRRQILDKQDSMQADHLNRIRELEDAHEIKLREAVRRVKSDVEEDWKDRIQSIERRHNDEIDELKADVATTRRRLEEAQREADAARRKVNISRTDGKLEAQLETEGIKSGLRESEELNRQLSSEIKKLREDHASLTGKYAALQQICDVSVVEAEAAKARAASTIAEAQTNQAAFTQALQRIQQLDSDSAQLRAENMMLRREVENRSADLRKLETTTHISNDRTASVESESRRVKAQSQAEIARLTSKIAELEAMTSVMSSQLDKVGHSEVTSLREIQREVERKETDILRLQDRFNESEVKIAGQQDRLQQQEKQIIKQQDTIFRKDREISELSQRIELLLSQLQDSRESAGVELDKASKRYEAEKLRNSKLEAEHREKVLAMEREVGEKIPGIVSAAVEKIEKEWSKKLIRETSELKDSYEFRLDKVNKDMLDIQTVFTEREARLKLNATEEKVELDRLKQTVRQLRRQVEDYEATIEDLRRENRFLQHNFNSYEQSMVVPTTAKKSFSSRSLQQPRTSSRKNLGRHFQFDQAYQRFSEIESDEQTEAAEKIEEEKEEAKILQEQLVNQTVALIQDQLTQMKRDITSVLRVPPPENIQGFQKDSVDHFEAMANASDTNSVVHIPETNNKGVKPIGLPPRSVTFSPKALFISPLRRDSFSNNSSFYSSSMTSPWGSVLNDSVGDGRFPGDAEALLSHIKAEESINSKAKHMNLSMQNESYLSISGIPNFTPASREEKAGEFWSVKTKNRADAELNFPAFDSLADGGYHEGYWKSKYGQKY